MQRTTIADRGIVVDILTLSFLNNKSVNYTIKQDARREQRIRKLMEYSFDICHLFGEVFITEDKKGCALVVMPDKKKTTLKSVLLDIKLVFAAIGITHLHKAMNREAVIKKVHPNVELYYLWFMGVQPAEQGKGIGSNLLNDIIQESRKNNRIICLETSTLKNIPWYQKHGFIIYKELDFGYKLYCMKHS